MAASPPPGQNRNEHNTEHSALMSASPPPGQNRNEHTTEHSAIMASPPSGQNREDRNTEHSPLMSSSPPAQNRDDHNTGHSALIDSKTALAADNTVFGASAIVFTVLLLMIAITVFVLCFRRFCLRRLSFHSDRQSVGNPLSPDRKPVAESFPVFVYECKNYSDQGLECAVCLSEFEEEEKGRILPACNHSFHVDCIDRWFESQSTCPICRAPARAAMSTRGT
ncbi:hypothetical protein SUGI_0112470 [Cryptomeria japonica]|uniref:RING-H2 finger protein ATL5-like n=1 Tax=Cryptomeria japonica TaxID=3369 RepID=UPI002408E66A|nr:RING-H2 finger protein ATL5-like [Cryptomeria japonica]GLJ09593.1 hypothetical protein SUGI_0112470 [Cryptomeria japonica]